MNIRTRKVKAVRSFILDADLPKENWKRPSQQALKEAQERVQNSSKNIKPEETKPLLFIAQRCVIHAPSEGNSAIQDKINKVKLKKEQLVEEAKRALHEQKESRKQRIMRRKLEEEAKKERQADISRFEELPFSHIDFELIECAICREYSYDNNQLACKDWFCSICTRLLLKDLLDNGEVFSPKCPCCNRNIPDEDFKKYLGQRGHQRLLQLRQKYEADYLVSNGRAVYCPMPLCGGFIRILNGRILDACARCHITICPSCFCMSHPNLTCQEYSEMNRDEELEKLIVQQKWKRCPYCSYLIEKIKGCHFVKCKSNVCKNLNRAVCYLCGKGLTEKDHKSHFSKSGPYGTTCNTIDGIED